jgi:metal-responsive CopG/Arc/MetJ family transcriptional regulator
MGIEIPETLATRLDAYVASVGATKSFIYREALVAYLSKKEKEKQKKK